MIDRYIEARKSHLNFYENIPLYSQTNENKFILYKPPGMSLSSVRVKDGRVPEKLYINQKDKVRSIREVQKEFNRQIKENLKLQQPEKVKMAIVNIMEETFKEPRSGSLEGVSETVDILVSDYTKNSEIIRKLLFVAMTDYTTAIHSINVMALVLGYAAYIQCSLAERKVLGLSALLHDVGKTQIDKDLLKAPRKLTEKEFYCIQRHTVMGYNILDKCRFGSADIKLSALQHHEKIDGSGYPNRTIRINKNAQIIGFIDCYEAITNDDRPYRNAMDPFKALELIKKDVEDKKFDRKIFETFAYSLSQ